MTPQEAKAGITRSALATMHRLAQRSTVSDVERIVSGYRAHRVVDTPMRLLEVLEVLSEDGRLLLRCTTYRPDQHADVAGFTLDYHEAQSLASVLRELEPPAEPEKGNGKAR